MNDWLKTLPSWQEAQNALRTHALKGLTVGGTLFLLIAITVFCLPRKYYSEAKLKVNPGDTLDPTATTGQTVSYFEPRENEINSVMEVLRSRNVTDGVVQLLGAQAILHRGAIPEVSDARVSKNPAPTRDHAHQQCVVLLEKSMQVFSPKRSNVIVLRCEAESPQLAQAINAAYLAVYRHVHSSASRTHGSFEFFVEQEALLREKRQEATGKLRDAKDGLGIATLAGRRTLLETQLTDVERNLFGSQTEVAASRARMAKLQSQLRETSQFTETTRAENANPAADTMRGELYKLQMKEQEYSARYTAAHPLVQDVREQVQEMQELLDAEGRTRVQTTSALNPAWTQLEASLLNETSSLDSQLARLESLDLQKGTLRAQLTQLNTDEIRLTELQQGVELAEKSYLETAQRLEQARIQQQLAADRITNVNVFQNASYVSKAIAPKRSLLLALGLFVSTFAGASTILAFAWLGHGFKSLEQLAGRLQLPVITSLRTTSMKPAL